MCSSGATKCVSAEAVSARCARASHGVCLNSPFSVKLQIEYHLVELPPVAAAGDSASAPSQLGPRIALIAPELLERLENEDERVQLCVVGVLSRQSLRLYPSALAPSVAPSGAFPILSLLLTLCTSAFVPLPRQPHPFRVAP